MSGSQFVPSTVSMYAPVLTGTSFASPNRTESIAQRVYLLLKSMRTILTPIEYKLANPTDNFDQLTRNDMNDIQKLLTLYQEVLNSNLKDLFAIIDNVVSEARNITYRKNINSHIEKIASTLIGTMFSITKISSSLIFEAAQEKTQESTNVKKSTSFSDINRHETVVCRICDERVPVERFEEHTESCIAAYQSEEKLNEVDQALLNQLHEIEDKYLKVDWPGIRVVMIQETIPILQVYLVLKRAYDIDPRIQDASDDLFLLENSLIYSKMSSRIIQLIQSATSLVKDKMRQSMALTSAASILRETRLSGSDQAVTVSAVSIVDFDFIKRISAGAYARVFLGRKKKTGDLYAIKVLPKHEMEIKNQVKRVLAERDILMQFNNPYIVNFCMYLLLSFFLLLFREINNNKKMINLVLFKSLIRRLFIYR